MLRPDRSSVLIRLLHRHVGIFLQVLLVPRNADGDIIANNFAQLTNPVFHPGK
jgi:hypothetical protein